MVDPNNDVGASRILNKQDRTRRTKDLSSARVEAWMQRLFTILLPLSILGGCEPPPESRLFAKDPVVAPVEREAQSAYERLRETTRFDSARVGSAGTWSANTVAFRKLLALPDAKRVFRTLFREASLPGKLYATCGFYFVDDEAFEAAVAALASSRRSVHTMQGCIDMDQVVGEMVRAHGERITVPAGITIEQWVKAHGAPTTFDIAGGYVPLRLVDDDDTMTAPRAPL